jgi:hypothetical protein
MGMVVLLRAWGSYEIVVKPGKGGRKGIPVEDVNPGVLFFFFFVICCEPNGRQPSEEQDGPDDDDNYHVKNGDNFRNELVICFWDHHLPVYICGDNRNLREGVALCFHCTQRISTEICTVLCGFSVDSLWILCGCLSLLTDRKVLYTDDLIGDSLTVFDWTSTVAARPRFRLRMALLS